MTEIFSFIGLIALAALAMIGVETLRRALWSAIKATPSEQGARLTDDDPLVDVLHRALANRTGKLRVSDAYLICGIQDQISRFNQTLCELGWERQRRRFNGSLQYAYVKGTATEREVELVVEYNPHLRSVSVEIGKSAPPPAN